MSTLRATWNKNYFLDIINYIQRWPLLFSYHMHAVDHFSGVMAIIRGVPYIHCKYV